MLEFVLELILQLFGEMLVDVAVHAVDESPRARTALKIAMYAGIGAAVGGLSLVVLPAHFIRNESLRLLALALTPIAVGTVFTAVGRRRLRMGKDVSALETFLPAFLFALAMAVVRYFGAE